MKSTAPVFVKKANRRFDVYGDKNLINQMEKLFGTDIPDSIWINPPGSADTDSNLALIYNPMLEKQKELEEEEKEKEKELKEDNASTDVVEEEVKKKPQKQQWTDASLCIDKDEENASELISRYTEAWERIRLSSPLFEYMYSNKNIPTIPAPLRRYSQITSKIERLTPLMVAVLLDNYYMVSELLIYNVGRIDAFHNTALDYAIKTDCDPRIIELLKEFETIRIRDFSTL